MSLDENKKLAMSTAQEIVSGRRLDLIPEIIHPDYTYRGQAGFTAKGPDGYRAVVETFQAAFSDLRSDIQVAIAEGDWVSMMFEVTGKNDGIFLGHPATGRQVTIRGIINCRISDHKVIEQVEMFDYVGLLQQLGLAEGLTAPMFAD